MRWQRNSEETAVELCWTCIGASRARTAAARTPQRSCERHRVAVPVLVRTRSQQARAGSIKRPQQRAGGYALKQAR